MKKVRMYMKIRVPQQMQNIIMHGSYAKGKTHMGGIGKEKET
jgi:hypothetical protein